MKISMVNHASVFIETEDIGFLSDPWFFGTAFNDSWALEYKTKEKLTKKVLDKLTHIYVSHEHPDHLHFPTLKYIQQNCKNKISIIIQNLPRKEILKALKKIGFHKIIEVKSRKFLNLKNNIYVYLYSVFPVDSACAFIKKNNNEKDIVILNLNDTELCNYDLRVIKKDIKFVDVLLNQFSFATYNGDTNYEKRTKKVRDIILKNYIYEQKFFKPNFSIPFASFSIFCNSDNKNLNLHRTDLKELRNEINKNNLKCKILLPGYELDYNKSSEFDEKLFERELFLNRQNILINKDSITKEEIIKSFRKIYDLLDNSFMKIFLLPIGKFIIYSPDIKEKFLVDFFKGNISTTKGFISEDLVIESNSLNYAFSHSWGMNTLTIGGNYKLKSKKRRFMYLRIILTLSNSNIKIQLNKESFSTLIFFIKNIQRISFQLTSTLFRILKGDI